MTHEFTEQVCEQFYDEQDSHYRSFWDKAGSLHWGIFDKTTGKDFLKACANLNVIMASHLKLNNRSRVIDLGCGNGHAAMWLAESTGCQVVGIDLSGVRIQNAKDTLKTKSSKIQDLVRFEKASLTDLPFKDESFTHGWCQATIYHVPDKTKALTESYRVLEKGATFVFDDLIKPKKNISAMAKQYVYDRLLFDTDFSFESYKVALQDVGFEVMSSRDLSDHLGTSYECLGAKAKQAISQDPEHFEALTAAYQKMVECIGNQELGWATYVCKK